MREEGTEEEVGVQVEDTVVSIIFCLECFAKGSNFRCRSRAANFESVHFFNRL